MNILKKAFAISAICVISVLFNACGNNNDFDAMGIFEADEVLVSAEVSGKIIEFSAVEGSELTQGQSSVRIDSTQMQLNEAKLSLQLQNAKSESTRLERLYQANAGTKKSYDDAHLQEQILQKELEIVRDSLAKSDIKAPISGIVLEKYAKLGELALPNKPLYKIANIDSLRLKAYFTNGGYEQNRFGAKGGCVCGFWQGI